MDMLFVSLIAFKILFFITVSGRIINETAEAVIELSSSNSTVSSSLNGSVIQESDSNSTDVPATVTIPPSTMTTRLQQRITEMRERSRQARLDYIQRHVLESLGWTRAPLIDPETRIHVLEEIRNGRYPGLADDWNKHCYHSATASCTSPQILPNYINRTMWYNASSNSLNLFFDVMGDHSTRIRTLENATLRLRMRRRAACDCDSEDETGMARIFISIYQYTRPLKPRFRIPRRRRLDSQRVISWTSERWITLDVKTAIREMYNTRRRNCGFQVLVRDMNDQRIDAKRVFYPSECHGESDYDCSINAETTTSQITDGTTSTNFGPLLEITTS